MLTEEKLRSGENLYHLISRTNSFLPGSNYKGGSYVYFRSAALVTPPPLAATLVGTIKTEGTSPIGLANHHFSTNFLANRDTISSNQSPMQAGS
jgi:hypothetical protein